ncbi:hypothetical protein Goe27_01670 [Bacillus phage vB_BsuM-Goe27]|nr:hypothetical protein Goe27_01670 [Bacillus phage vB_BsuM-Goe27]
MQNKFDLTKPDFAYFYGFIQADGSLSEDTRNRGRLRIEVGYKDCSLLEKFKELLPYNSSIRVRERDTNFKEGYKSAILSVYSLGLREDLISLGMAYGKKSDSIAPMPGNCSINDYFRGIIDGDGSLGITAQGFPFVSLVTESDTLKDEYLAFLKTVTGKTKTARRNTRDNVYNITVYKEDAQELVKALNYQKGLCLDRKKKKAEEVLNWVRPAGMRKVTNQKPWTEEEDNYVLTHSVQEAAEHLGRTLSSIKNRKFRLRSR